MTAVTLEASAHRLRWEYVYEDAYPRVYRGLVAMGARPDEAEDALHDAFLKGLERKAEEIASADGWIFVVASRVWRRRRIRERLLLPWTLLFAEATSLPDEAGTGAIVALRALPMRQRQVMVARFVVGLTQQETATLLGIARGTVAATTHQATAAMRRRMEVHT